MATAEFPPRCHFCGWEDPVLKVALARQGLRGILLPVLPGVLRPIPPICPDCVQVLADLVATVKAARQAPTTPAGEPRMGVQPLVKPGSAGMAPSTAAGG